MTIYSVKRDSDGEVFSIGDKVKPVALYILGQDNEFIVEEIRVTVCSKNGVYCYLHNKGTGVRLDAAEKVK